MGGGALDDEDENDNTPDIFDLVKTNLYATPYVRYLLETKDYIITNLYRLIEPLDIDIINKISYDIEAPTTEKIYNIIMNDIYAKKILPFLIVLAINDYEYNNITNNINNIKQFILQQNYKSKLLLNENTQHISTMEYLLGITKSIFNDENSQLEINYDISPKINMVQPHIVNKVFVQDVMILENINLDSDSYLYKLIESNNIASSNSKKEIELYNENLKVIKEILKKLTKLTNTNNINDVQLTHKEIKQLILFIININNELYNKPVDNILNYILNNKLVDNIKNLLENKKIIDYNNSYNNLVNNKDNLQLIPVDDKKNIIEGYIIYKAIKLKLPENINKDFINNDLVPNLILDNTNKKFTFDKNTQYKFICNRILNECPKILDPTDKDYNNLLYIVESNIRIEKLVVELSELCTSITKELTKLLEQNNKDDTINIDETTKRMIKLCQNNLRKLKREIYNRKEYVLLNQIDNSFLADIPADTPADEPVNSSLVIQNKNSVQKINSYNLGRIVNVLNTYFKKNYYNSDVPVQDVYNLLIQNNLDIEHILDEYFDGDIEDILYSIYSYLEI